MFTIANDRIALVRFHIHNYYICAGTTSAVKEKGELSSLISWGPSSTSVPIVMCNSLIQSDITLRS